MEATAPSTSENSQGRNPMNEVSVGKHLFKKCSSLSIREIIQEKRPIYAVSVQRLSLRRHSLWFIRESIQERDPIVVNVGNLSLENHIL